MKKFKILSLFMFLILFINGCTLINPKYINFSTKPNNHYYTDQLNKKILNNESFTISVFDTNLYKEIQVSNDDSSIIENFIKSLVTSDYIDESVSDKEPFRLKITFKDSKFLIKVFNNATVSISPWDGNYAEDFISMKDVPLRYNLYDFCNYIENK